MASLHIVNESSVADLDRRVRQNNPKGIDNYFLSHEQFRPNVVLDLEKPYQEDDIQEIRVGGILMRNIGPTLRCNAIRLNLDKCEKV